MNSVVSWQCINIHFSASDGRHVFGRTFLAWDLWSTMTCLCVLSFGVWSQQKMCTPPKPPAFTNSLCLLHLNRETKGRINGKFPWVRITGADNWFFFIASLNGLKISEGDFSQNFFCSLVRGNEWGCYFHPPFIIQELVSFGGVEVPWVIRLLERISVFFFSFFFPLFILWITSETHPTESQRAKFNRNPEAVTHFIGGETIHGYLRESNCISDHQLLTQLVPAPFHSFLHSLSTEWTRALVPAAVL